MPNEIYKAHDFVDRAVDTLSYQATIEPFGNPVLVTSIQPGQREVEQYARLLRCKFHIAWVCLRDGVVEAVEISRQVQVRRVCISEGLADPPRRKEAHDDREPSPPPPYQKEYTYIVILEGKNASLEGKTVAKNTRQGIADVIMYEALNGYSTIFSGAILRRNFDKLFRQEDGDWKFNQIDNLEHAIDVEMDDKKGMTTAVIC